MLSPSMTNGAGVGVGHPRDSRERTTRPLPHPDSSHKNAAAGDDKQ